jgi:hypothetical protein
MGHHSIKERDWGWVISWLNKREAPGSMAARALHADGRPFLIDRKTARIVRGHEKVPVCGRV